MRRGVVVVLAVIGALAVVSAAPAMGASHASKKGKIKACVARHGPDKGLMRFSKKKCKRGERKVTWNKKGPAGAAGQNGAPGPTNKDLLALIQEQASQIKELTNVLNGLAPQVAALCSQASALTTQANALATVLGGIGLGGLIPPGLDLDVPSLPPPLAAFSCP
jgi:hypothetical protein